MIIEIQEYDILNKMDIHLDIKSYYLYHNDYDTH